MRGFMILSDGISSFLRPEGSSKKPVAKFWLFWREVVHIEKDFWLPQKTMNAFIENRFR